MTAIFVAVVLTVLIYVGEDIVDRTVVIRHIAIPHQLQERGYTSDTVIQKLLNNIDVMRDSNKFRRVLPTLSSTLASPDITVPRTGISLRSLVSLIRHGDIVGEIVVRPPQSAIASSNNDDTYELYLTSSDQHQEVKSSDLDDLFMRGAKSILKMVDMFSLAAYLEHRDPNTALDLVHELLLDDIPKDDSKWIYAFWGNILVDEFAFDEALAKYKIAGQIDPNFVLAWNGIGIDYTGKGDFPNAINAFARATVADPKSAYAWNNWGDILLQQNDLDGAIDKYRMSTTLLPRLYAPWSSWGDALVLKKEYQEAIEKYRFAITIDPDAISQWDAWSLGLVWVPLYVC